MDLHYTKCVKALKRIILIADTGTDEHREALKLYYDMGDTPTGWRVAEAMRAVAQEVLCSNDGATQEPVMPQKCAKCSGGGMVQRWTGEYVECDACNARGF